MDYEDLIGTLYDLARETKDEELQSRLYDLGWIVKKNGIRDESEDQNEELHFKELLYRLESLIEQARDLADKIVINDLKNLLAADGIDGYFGNYL